MSLEPADLTPREAELLIRVARGATYRNLAREWDVAEITVRGYGHRLLSKLGANSIAHAVHLAHGLGLLRRERHGDHAGYIAHGRRGEPVCEACKAGEADYRSGLKTRRDAA